MDAPRLILICCEGKTEEKYFKIISDVFRGPYHMSVEIYGEKGQHKSLIDYTANMAQQLTEEQELNLDDMVSWAVCDDDKMDLSYNELHKYAEDKGVLLAFARPQFEAYLVQHFEQSKECGRQALYDILSQQRKLNNAEGNYNDSTKADLLWLDRAIREKPSLVDIAITNSNLRTKQQMNPFFTVHLLTEYIKNFELR